MLIGANYLIDEKDEQMIGNRLLEIVQHNLLAGMELHLSKIDALRPIRIEQPRDDAYKKYLYKTEMFVVPRELGDSFLSEINKWPIPWDYKEQIKKLLYYGGENRK